MKDLLAHLVTEYGPSIVVFIFGALILLGFGGYRYVTVSQDFDLTKETLASTTASLTLLKQVAANLETDNTRLAELLQAEQAKNNAFESQIRGIASTVGTLEKLQKTDPELLQKYSKVYFLNEHYVPVPLTAVNQNYWVDKNKPMQILAPVRTRLDQLLDAASSSGMKLLVASAYRSFDTQTALKSRYKVSYGSGANKFSADQGYSEHQLGTTVDMTTPKLGADFTKFETEPAYKWLTDNAHKYGFVLSYPKNNTYYQFEPWHWRFVGVDLATRLHQEGKYFYDFDQREIDKYLVTIFD